MLISVYGSSVFVVEANLITIEVNIGKGIGYHLVGLPDNAVKESNYRIAAALTNIEYKLPGKKNHHQYGTCRCTQGRLYL